MAWYIAHRVSGGSAVLLVMSSKRLLVSGSLETNISTCHSITYGPAVAARRTVLVRQGTLYTIFVISVNQSCIRQSPAPPGAAWINPSREKASPGNTDRSTVISGNRVSPTDGHAPLQMCRYADRPAVFRRAHVIIVQLRKARHGT